MIEAFRAVMGNPRWTFVRALFNKDLDDKVREMMKSQAYMSAKGINSV